MKRILLFSILILSFSCETNNPTNICGDGKNLCFEINGTPISFNTSWTGDQHSFWISGTQVLGSDTQTVSFVSYYPTVVGEYDMISYMIEFHGVQFGYQNDTVFYESPSEGKLHLSNVFQNKLTGDFNCRLYCSTDTNLHSLSNGHLDAIPHQ